jgi:hypothetical protein
MVDLYDPLARKSGARIVSFCGHDCVPWDLAVLTLHSAMKKRGENLVEVSFYDEINSAPSGRVYDVYGVYLNLITYGMVYLTHVS